METILAFERTREKLRALMDGRNEVGSGARSRCGWRHG
jgi:hypothetical protein